MNEPQKTNTIVLLRDGRIARKGPRTWTIYGNNGQVYPFPQTFAQIEDIGIERVIYEPADPPMGEPTQIGYPVMARCAHDTEQHLHARSLNRDWPWRCKETVTTWERLYEPRDLTADEIREHNLWTGGDIGRVQRPASIREEWWNYDTLTKLSRDLVDRKAGAVGLDNAAAVVYAVARTLERRA